MLVMLRALHALPDEVTLASIPDEQADRGRSAVRALLETLAQHDATAFRRGVRAALQAAVDDLHQLTQRRARMGAREDTTQVIVGIARRLAALPMPASEEDAAEVMPAEVLQGRVASMVLPSPHWESVSGMLPDGTLVFGAPHPTDEEGQALQHAWTLAADLVRMVRYA